MNIKPPTVDRDRWRELKSGAPTKGFDPYPIFAQLHAQAPVWKSDWGPYYVSGYENVSRLLRDVNLIQGRDLGPQGRTIRTGTQQALADLLNSWLLFRDPPQHTELRRQMVRLLATANRSDYAPVIRKAAGRLVDDVPRGSFCAVRTVGRPLPTEVICQIAAVPGSWSEHIESWSLAFREILDVGVDGSPPDLLEDCADAFNRLGELAASPEWRSKAFWGKIDHVCSSLPQEILASNLVFLIFSGQETTVHLIGSLIHHLANNPKAWKAIDADRSLIAAAVEETLRLESPVQKVSRIAAESFTLDGIDIPAGSSVVLLLGAANRDPSVFDEPDGFNIHRPARRHLSFGASHHFCIGSKLAIMEAEIALETMLDRWESLEATEACQYHANTAFRGPDIVPVRVARRKNSGLV